MIIIQKLVSSDGAIAFSAAAHQPVTHLARDNHNPPGGSALSHRHQGRLWWRRKYNTEVPYDDVILTYVLKMDWLFKRRHKCDNVINNRVVNVVQGDEWVY